MMPDAKLYGLSSSERRILFHILHSHKASLHSVRLFGSRARGDYRKTSDIDLAVSGQASTRLRLAADFAGSRLPYTVDIVDYDANTNPVLRRNIDRDGRIIFFAEEGIPSMTLEQIKAKFSDYNRAIERLRSALEKDASLDDMYLDATIQRFEFCFELAWRLMNACLEYEGFSANSPRSSIHEGFKANLIADAAAWLDMLEQRNLASHTYDDEMAAELYRQIKERHFELLSSFRDEMAHRTVEE